MDSAMANTVGAMAATIVACALSFIIDRVRRSYYSRILHRYGGEPSKLGSCVYDCLVCLVKCADCLKLGRRTDRVKVEMQKKLKKRREEVETGDKTEIMLDKEEEELLVESLVGAQNLNIWAILMPAVYQLVPGSMIAKLWFNSILPPPLKEETSEDGSVTVYTIDEAQYNVFSNLMVISTSLAIGLLLGFAIVELFYKLYVFCVSPVIVDATALSEDEKTEIEVRNDQLEDAADRFQGLFTAPDEDPVDGFIKTTSL